MKMIKVVTLVNDYKIYLLLLLGLFIRLILADLPGMKIDTDAWFAWALRLQDGFTNFYSDTVWTNYTPGYLYILYILGFLKGFFSLDTNNFNYLLKTPSIIGEVLLGWVTYKLIIKKQPKSLATWAAGFVLFNPFTIFNSAIWGQIEGILTLLMLLAISYLNFNQPIFSSVFAGLSFLVKPQAIALAPVFFYNALKQPIRNFPRISLPAIVVIFIYSLPFFPNNPLGIVNLFSKMVSDYSYTSLYALNIWPVLVGMWISDNQKFWLLNYSQWGQILLAFYWITVFSVFRKQNISYLALAVLTLLSFSFLPTRVHERYLYPGLIFLIIYSFYVRDKFLITLSSILSLIHFLNLYYVYVYYNEFHLKLPQLLYYQPLYDSIEKNFTFLSIISTLIFIVSTFKILKKEYV